MRIIRYIWESNVQIMNSDKLTTVILIAIAILLIFGLRFKKRKEAENGSKLARMEKEGDFKGLKNMYGKYAVIWTTLGVAIVAISAFRVSQNRISAVTGFIVGGLFLYRAYALIRAWRAYGRAEKHLSYRLSEEEIDAFWMQENNEDIFYGLFDYISKKSYYEGKLELLNQDETMIYALAKLEQEVNNGGFSQFFFNTNDKFNSDLVRYAGKVGADDIAKIVGRALQIKGLSLSEDKIDEMLNSECDDAFYKSKDYLADLCAEYAKAHKSSFLS